MTAEDGRHKPAKRARVGGGIILALDGIGGKPATSPGWAGIRWHCLNHRESSVASPGRRGAQKMVPAQWADVFWFVNSGYLFFAPLSHSIKSCGFQVTVAVGVVAGAAVVLAVSFQARRPTPKVV